MPAFKITLNPPNPDKEKAPFAIKKINAETKGEAFGIMLSFLKEKEINKETDLEEVDYKLIVKDGIWKDFYFEVISC